MTNPINNKITETRQVHIITSKNNPELAKKMRELSKFFMKKNDQLYRDLANK